MNITANLSKNLLMFSLILSFFGAICFAQEEKENKFDLEVTAQAASETARGGETFSYTVTVKNTGAATATNVILMQDGDLGETTASASAGVCALLKESAQIPKPFQCRLGDIEKGESVIINFSIRLKHFGGEPEEYNRSPVMLPSITGQSENSKKSIIADINVTSEETEANTENNIVTIRAELLPSTNLPPRIEIVLPKVESTYIKPLTKKLEIPLLIKAFDPDGKITKVRVNEQNFQIIIEDNQYKFVFGGKKYTAQEAEDRREELEQYFGGDAVSNGNGTYSYVLKNLKYGINRVFVDTTDDGERFASTSLEIEVKSDATMEIVSPVAEQVIAPGTNLTFETASKFGNGITPQLRILGVQEENFIPKTFAEVPLMQQVSKTGDAYKHQFVWKVPKEGDFEFTIIAFENGEDTKTSQFVRITGAYPRIIKFISLKNGQVFDSQKPIEIKIEARDSKGTIVPDRFDLLIDGKKFVEMNNSLCEECLPKSYIWSPPFLTKGTHTIQVIGRNWRGIELGKSEVITITVK